MNKQEALNLLKEIAAVDNRKLSQETVDAWYKVIGVVPFDIAQEALHLARADERITYLEPKHIIAKAKVAAEELDRIERLAKAPEPVQKGDPCPTCIHDKCITWCNECCARLNAYHKTHEQIQLQVCGCHEFAMRELVA